MKTLVGLALLRGGDIPKPLHFGRAGRQKTLHFNRTKGKPKDLHFLMEGYHAALHVHKEGDPKAFFTCLQGGRPQGFAFRQGGGTQGGCISAGGRTHKVLHGRFMIPRLENNGVCPFLDKISKQCALSSPYFHSSTSLYGTRRDNSTNCCRGNPLQLSTSISFQHG